MRVTKKLLLGSVVATAALALAACAPTTAPGGESTEGAGPAEVTVGIVTSESGPLSGYGTQYLDAFEAGLDYATDGTSEIDGTAINVEYRDDAGDPDKAVTAVKELIGEGVDIIAGTASSGVALAVAEQAAQNQVLYVSGTAAADAITGINGARAMSGEWLRTGDLVARDAHGIFRLVDRLKDIFISGGENVAPAEVEHALTLHPLVEAAAVVGVPDPVWGERGVAFVVPAPGAALSGDEVLAHAHRNLAAFKVPVRVEFVDALPRSTIEKLARSRLRARARALMAADRAGERDRTTEGMP